MAVNTEENDTTLNKFLSLIEHDMQINPHRLEPLQENVKAEVDFLVKETSDVVNRN